MIPVPRLVWWSIRREIWQHRSIVVAPVAVGIAMVVGALTILWSAGDLVMQFNSATTIAARRGVISPGQLVFSANMIQLAAYITALVYSVDALYGERRDRSILFWKSLPVSDVVTVASKAAIPLVVIPAVTFATVIVTMLLEIAIIAGGVLVNGGPTELALGDNRITLALLLTLPDIVASTLWQAPVFGWLIFVSGFARRAPILWAILPPFVLSALEYAATRTGHLAEAFKSRLGSSDAIRRIHPVQDGETWISSWLQFITSIDVLAGLAIAVALIAGAVWLRRRAEPF